MFIVFLLMGRCTRLCLIDSNAWVGFVLPPDRRALMFLFALLFVFSKRQIMETKNIQAVRRIDFQQHVFPCLSACAESAPTSRPSDVRDADAEMWSKRLSCAECSWSSAASLASLGSCMKDLRGHLGVPHQRHRAPSRSFTALARSFWFCASVSASSRLLFKQP